MRTLYLHIGQGKTATSYLQTVLASSRTALIQHNITYPVTEKIRQKLAKKLNTGGNGLGLSDCFDRPSNVETYEFPSEGNVLLSHEGLISRLLFDNSELILDELCNRHDFESVSFLVFFRNPVSHAVSSYRQLVKRSGMTHSLNEYCKAYHSPIQLARFLKRYQNRENIKICARNYSSCRNTLLTELAMWLSVPEEDLVDAPQGEVNRSLTMAELMFQWELNKNLKSRIEIFSDPLFETLPQTEPEKLFPGFSAQEAMLERLRPHMQYVNDFLDNPDNHYQEDLTRPKGQTQIRDKYEFTREQLAALAKIYAEAIKKHS